MGLECPRSDMGTSPVTIDAGFVFHDRIYDLLYVFISLRFDAPGVGVQSVGHSTDRLPAEEVGTHHPVPRVIILCIRDTEDVLQEVFHLRYKGK